MAASTVAMTAMAWDGSLTREEGVVLLATALVDTAAIVGLSRRESRAAQAEFACEYGASRCACPTFETVLHCVVLRAGVGLIVVAIGTSAPELATTGVGTLRNDRDIAIGNLLGSSVYNILAVLGITSLVLTAGLRVEPHLVFVDISVMALVKLAYA